MRLATLATDDGSKAVVVRDGGAVPVDGYGDVGALLQDGGAGLAAARAAATDGSPGPLDHARLLRPVLHPGAVVCVGLNYRAHILEMGRDLPTDPTLFTKLPRALTDPYAEVELPAPSRQVDYEAELAVVIGTRVPRHTSEADALGHVFGYSCFNDMSVRDYQKRTPQWKGA